MAQPIFEIKLNTNQKRVSTSQLIKQLGSKLDTSQSLIFPYPVIIDKTLRKFEEPIRDFFTVQMINSIKESSVLDIISTATSIGSGQDIGTKFVNPAEKLTTDLGKTSDVSSDLTNAFVNQQSNQEFSTNQSKQEYQEKIDTFREFIAQQVKTDPKFDRLRPFISSVSVNNLIDIPLVIATSNANVHSHSLYWTLFASAGLKKPLDSTANLNKIKPIIRNIPNDQYMQLLDPESKIVDRIRNIDDPNVLSKIIASNEDNLDRTIKMFSRVLNINSFAQDVPGVGSSDKVAISRVLSNTEVMRNNLMRSASGLFSAYVSDDIVGLLQSVTHAVNSETEADVASKLSDFSGSTISDSREFYNLLVNNMLEGIFAESMTDNDALIEKSQNVCAYNSKITVKQSLTELNLLSFSLKGSTSDLADFVEKLVRVSAKLNGFSQQLESNLGDLGRAADIPNANKGLDGLFKDFREKIRVHILNYFTSKSHGSSVLDVTNIDSDPTNKLNLSNSARFNKLLNNSGDITQFIQTMSKSISDIMFFMAIYSFQSYYCEYLSEIHAEVETQKKGALEFPNYLLVIPSWMVVGIYNALASKNFKDMLANQDDTDRFNQQEEFDKTIRGRISKSVRQSGTGSRLSKTRDFLTGSKSDGTRLPFESRVKSPVRRDKFQAFSTSEREIRRMIPKINNLLKIPNLIVVDEQKNELYYNWMFMDSNHMLTINTRTIKNYVDHQIDTKPGF